MRLLDSVVVSTIVSETKIFTCYEFPEWTRWLWVIWAILPTLVISTIRAVDSIRSDFMAGLSFIGGLFVPVVIATG